jgi:hypothetical protein
MPGLRSRLVRNGDSKGDDDDGCAGDGNGNTLLVRSSLPWRIKFRSVCGGSLGLSA